MGQKRPWGLTWRSSSLFVVGTVGIALFTDLFLYGIIVPILPYLLEDHIHIPHNQIQGYVSGLLAIHALASVLFSPIAGIIADRASTSAKLPFLGGLLALLLATLLLCLGQTFAVLAIARVLQGMSVAVVWTIGLALVRDTVGPEKLGTTIGSIFGFVSIGQLVAPVLGGVVYSKAGILGIFWMAFAVLVLDSVMRVMLIEKKTAERYVSAQQTEAGVSGSEEDDGDALVRDEAREEEPLLERQELRAYKLTGGESQTVITWAFPLISCLRHPRLLTALHLALSQAILLSAFDSTISTVAQEYFRFTSLEAGLLYLAIVVPYVIGGPIAGRIVDKRGPKGVAVFAFGFLVPSLSLLHLARPGGKDQVAIYCAILSLNG
ncbi:hypothetical protein EPUS_04811 [Endocarpon pusillum Z07020]|uniref:Major facilitator superfamily (MFS) profile domain-containing protein n=1 Tax=Endocarpon pusillum (strain Z07020 / HMAS-L-300199) TaxID=1263415 RepID=U1GKN1_ENDPU|nr:uncharacterized protein EPUS_04811 [Endocarpon pusillum Z07020]ERF72758.1 hypothetical protein EPUS_04811 [Endocarpon pusillum Z07020]